MRPEHLNQKLNGQPNSWKSSSAGSSVGHQRDEQPRQQQPRGQPARAPPVRRLDRPGAAGMVRWCGSMQQPRACATDSCASAGATALSTAGVRTPAAGLPGHRPSSSARPRVKKTARTPTASTMVSLMYWRATRSRSGRPAAGAGAAAAAGAGAGAGGGAALAAARDADCCCAPVRRCGPPPGRPAAAGPAHRPAHRPARPPLAAGPPCGRRRP